MDAHVPFQAVKEIICEVLSIPFVEGRAEALTQHGDDRLSNQSHRHLPVTDNGRSCGLKDRLLQANGPIHRADPTYA